MYRTSKKVNINSFQASFYLNKPPVSIFSWECKFLLLISINYSKVMGQLCHFSNKEIRIVSTSKEESSYGSIAGQGLNKILFKVNLHYIDLGSLTVL